MEKSIRVRILGRDYPLRVREEDERFTREVAEYVDAKMQVFKEAHPDQSDLITAVVTALSLAEELFTTWERDGDVLHSMDQELRALDQRLIDALVDRTEAPTHAISPSETAP